MSQRAAGILGILPEGSAQNLLAHELTRSELQHWVNSLKSTGDTQRAEYTSFEVRVGGSGQLSPETEALAGTTTPLLNPPSTKMKALVGTKSLFLINLVNTVHPSGDSLRLCSIQFLHPVRDASSGFSIQATYLGSHYRLSSNLLKVHKLKQAVGDLSMSYTIC